MIEKTFTVRLHMESDWHIGAGVGQPGSVDRLVQRDAHDLPYVPGRTLIGIWRDACERLAYGLDNGEGDTERNEGWSTWVHAVFGTEVQPPSARRRADEREPPGRASPPRPALLIAGAAHLAPALTSLMAGDAAGKQELRREATFIKPGVSLDPATGGARKDFLRFEEMARAGAVLDARCSVLLPDDQARGEVIQSLLVGGARLVERLGGKRRRGAGRCRMEIIGLMPLEAAVSRLAMEPPAIDENLPAPFAPRCRSASEDDLGRSAAADWVAVPLRLAVRTPLTIPARTTGNIVETLDFVPGTYLLGHLTAKLRELRFDPTLAIAAGDVRVRPATIEVAGRAAVALPLALCRAKDDPGPSQLYNLFEGEVAVAGSTGVATQLRPMEGRYVDENPAGRLSLASVPLVLRTHGTMDDERQRPTAEVGGVFSCQAIAPGTVLRSELRIRKDVATKLATRDATWWTRLEGTLRLGRARHADYGEVELKTVGAPEVAAPRSGTPSAAGELRVWLLSDVLLRGATLRFEAAVERLAEEIGRGLGVTLEVVESGTKRAQEGLEVGAVVRTRRIESWQVSWGLPRPSLLAIQAGSCARFRVGGSLDQAAVARLELDGIGERRGEGYGWIRFDPPLLEKSDRPRSVERCEATPPAFTTAPLTEPDPAWEFARLVEETAHRSWLVRRARALGQQRDVREWLLGIRESTPSPSQLAALRRVIERLVEPGEPAVSRIRRDVRDKRWPKGGLDRIEWLLSQRDHIWKLVEGNKDVLDELGMWHGGSALSLGKPGPRPALLTEGAEVRLQTTLWPFAVRAVIDESVRAHKRATERAGST